MSSSRAEYYVELMKQQATRNVDKWGEQDRDKLVLVCIEELGELAQAHLQHLDEGGELQRVIEEAVDLGAVGFQFGVEPDIGKAITDVYENSWQIEDGVGMIIPRMLTAIRFAGLCSQDETVAENTAAIIVLCACICADVEAARNADA